MKATIYDLVPGTRLRDVVPPAYRDAAMKDARADGVYSVLLFDHAERDVVPRRPFARRCGGFRAPRRTASWR